MSSEWAAAVLGCVVFAGAAVQRLTGVGFALVAVPGLALLLGPASGVALSNCASGAISASGLASTWRGVRPATMLPLVAAAAVTVPVGAWLAVRLPDPVLLTCTGVVVTAAVLLVMRGLRARALRGRGGAVAAGAASGLMNASAGVGGPAVSLYAVNAGWTVREFVPNAQFYGVVVNAFSVTVKGLPHLTGRVWLLAAAGLAAGEVLGRFLAPRTPERAARLTVLLLALGGGLTTLVKGLTSL
ncbi:TSUP family transporter [Streptomyces sp. RFCAC02]|uniref:TSUP family transporter n=1 Tax=Streptomyces sp. RFCAC02 TaxID=2499143 RepID=UPI001F0E43C8|nr:TSUP family transporter [Streptomyces sp. RFCAC02]